jgi:predicted transcriptional regulator
MSKVLSARVPDDLAAWVDECAESRGVSRGELLELALSSFRPGGVPEVRERVVLPAEVGLGLQVSASTVRRMVDRGELAGCRWAASFGSRRRNSSGCSRSLETSRRLDERPVRPDR